MEEQLKELTMMVRAIYDQQLIMNAKIDGLDKRVGNIEDRLDRIESRMDGLEQRMDKLESKVDNLEQRMDSLEGKVDKLEQRMDQFNHTVDSLKQGTHNLEVKVDQVAALFDQKVTRIEQEGIDTQERLKYIRSVLVRHDEEILALGLKRSV